MSSDSVLSPIEKQSIKKEMESLATEYTALYNLAASHNYPSTATLAGNYNNLVSFMSTYLSSLTTSSNVAGATVRSYFASYYDSVATTNSWLTHNVKELADAAQTKANAAAASALVAANTAVWGNISGIPGRFKDAPLGEGLQLNSSALGYFKEGVWKTFMDNAGNFYLTGSNPEHSLAWNATSNTLNIRGNIEANTIKADAVIVNTTNIVDNAVSSYFWNMYEDYSKHEYTVIDVTWSETTVTVLKPLVLTIDGKAGEAVTPGTGFGIDYKLYRNTVELASGSLLALDTPSYTRLGYDYWNVYTKFTVPIADPTTMPDHLPGTYHLVVKAFFEPYGTPTIIGNVSLRYEFQRLLR